MDRLDRLYIYIVVIYFTTEAERVGHGNSGEPAQASSWPPSIPPRNPSRHYITLYKSISYYSLLYHIISYHTILIILYYITYNIIRITYNGKWSPPKPFHSPPSENPDVANETRGDSYIYEYVCIYIYIYIYVCFNHSSSVTVSRPP